MDHLNKNLLTIHLTANDFHDMWKKACDTAARCIAEAKENNKQREICIGGQTHRGIFNRKHPEFPVSLVKPYFQKDKDKFSSRKKNTTPPAIVDVEDSPGPVRKIRLNGKDQRQYFVIFENQTADKEKWLAEDAIPDGNLHLRRLRASRRTEQSHQ
ncbi:hypothetical protein O181_088717 [Austropuccinia psidii MF-1]|uniref:Uncharacterized protein n=1 Tax=Austropuccinia psidii MF-1 TaxID=1389203 RepID=A0A9Q3IS68_9BASI|nr:hypothetical protein [Austropuccinia psidii MF-1]